MDLIVKTRQSIRLWFVLFMALECVSPCLGVEKMVTGGIRDMGGFYSIKERGLMNDQVYKSDQIARKCECRQLCLANSSCTAFSTRPYAPDLLLCQLANRNIFANTPSIVPNSTYHVRKELAMARGIDQLFYRRLTTPVNGFLAAKEACEAIPGFYLISVRFQAQMAILLEICLGRRPFFGEIQCVNSAQWFYVNMIKVDDAIKIRGEIPVEETDLWSYTVKDGVSNFMYADAAMLQNKHANWTTKPVCQANAFNVTW